MGAQPPAPTSASGQRSLQLLRIQRSPLARKKWRAEWSDGKHTDFGAAGYQDYTMHHDTERRRRYRLRHASDPIHDPQTAGALSWYILWGDSTSFETNVRAYKRRFKL